MDKDQRHSKPGPSPQQPSEPREQPQDGTARVGRNVAEGDSSSEIGAQPQTAMRPSGGGDQRRTEDPEIVRNDAAAKAAHPAAGGDPAAEGAEPSERDASNIPSSLNLDRRGSAVRTGRAEMAERRRLHTEASPEVSGGDIDADWVSGEFVGDETPAGDNPTPGMSVVEDVGKAIGVEYQDTEELKGAEKIEERDRHRWELDPASSEDYEDRNRDKGGS